MLVNKEETEFHKLDMGNKITSKVPQPTKTSGSDTRLSFMLNGLRNVAPPRTCQSVHLGADMHLLLLFIACACTFAAQSEYEAFDAEFLDSPTPTTSTTNTLITCHAGPSAGVIVTGHYVVVTKTHTVPCTLPTSTPDGDQSRGCPRSKKHHCNCHGQSCDSDMIGEEYV